MPAHFVRIGMKERVGLKPDPQACCSTPSG